MAGSPRSTRLRLAARASGAPRGFMLVELILYLSIVGLLALYGAAQLTRTAEETLTKASGEYLRLVVSASQQHVLLNWSNYTNNTAVSGVATLLKPTVAELVALGRLNPGFPSGAGAMPTRQTVRVDITRTGCPGPTCTVQVLACTTTPVTLGGNITRFDLASMMTAVQEGSGGQSLQNAGTTIRGPAVNAPNPLGNVEGIVCGTGNVDTALYQRFLTLNETRDPNFQGAVTIAGATTVNSTLTVGGDTTLNGNLNVGNCFTLHGAGGRAGFNCTSPTDIPPGYKGGVRAADVVSHGTVLASSTPSTFNGSNGAYAYMSVTGGVGEVRTSGRAQADRLVPSGTYAINATCTAADEGAIARDSAGSGLVVCRSARWRALATFAIVGAACSPNGGMADDGAGVKLLCLGGTWQPMSSLWAAATPGAACANQGTVAYDTSNASEMLLCRLNPAGGVARWMRMRDVTANLVFVQSYEVTDISLGASGQISKPACTPAGGMSASAVVQLVPKVYSSSDGGAALYAIDVGSAWQIYLRNGSNAVLTGNPSARAIANVFCFFA